MDVKRQTELNAIISQCGFVPNPTKTMDGTRVNPINWDRLDAGLAALYAEPKRKPGRPRKEEATQG